jgi:hypothetical protein
MTKSFIWQFFTLTHAALLMSSPLLFYPYKPFVIFGDPNQGRHDSTEKNCLGRHFQHSVAGPDPDVWERIRILILTNYLISNFLCQ